jgi:thiol:disulfide interchange protein DsbC
MKSSPAARPPSVLPAVRRPTLAALAAALLLPALLACTPPTSADARQAAAAAPQAAAADVDARIRQTLATRIPSFPPIDDISATPVPGIYEVRYAGTEILYTDASGDHIFVEGVLIATEAMVNLTQQRLDKLMAIPFAQLPLDDAIVFQQGKGERKIAVFADPNCGFCRRFERDLAGIDNVTIYTFLIPILGPDSTVKSRNVWCAADRADAWRGLMLQGRAAPSAAEGCDTGAIERNLAFSREHRINGTPALVFEDGTRKPGALPAEQVEELLAAAAKKS